ncbi:MAG TPA: extracellular solute-binding protein, partial [Candidatus Limnocylindrales bacterium]
MRIALVGAGRIGQLHGRLVAAQPAVTEVVVADLDADRAREAASAVDGRVAATVDEAIESADAVIVAASTNAHASLVRQAVDRGKPTFCEKPLAFDLPETVELVDHIERIGAVVQVGFQRRFDPGYVEARRLVESGELGTVYLVRLIAHDHEPPPDDYVPVSGGLFRDSSIHDFDALRWVTGLEVDELYADGSVRRFEVFARNDDVDTGAVILRLSDGTIGVLGQTRHDPRGYDIRMEIVAERDSVAVGLAPRTPLRSLEPVGVDMPGPAWTTFLTRFGRPTEPSSSHSCASPAARSRARAPPAMRSRPCASRSPPVVLAPSIGRFGSQRSDGVASPRTREEVSLTSVSQRGAAGPNDRLHLVTERPLRRRSMKLHKWLGLLVPVVLAVGACSSAASSSPGTSAAAGGKLTIAAVQGVEDAGLKALAPMYTQKTGVQIEIVEAPYADLYTKLVTAFSANDATYDLAMMDDPWMPKFGTDGSLTDLGPLGITKDPDIAQVVWDVGTWPPPRGAVPPTEKSKAAQLLGVTIVGNVEMFMWRKDLSPTGPASYDEVLANAKSQNKSDFAGYIIRGKATNPVVADFLPILWSFGGDVFDENWNVVFDNQQSLSAVKFLVEDLKAVAQADPASTDAADRDR